jgi:O-antigen/teichoic acid export membrane protein
MPDMATVEASATRQSSASRVAKNTLFLTASQAVTVPLAVLVNALTARYLGPEEFGYMYMAGTLSGFGVLAVGWGHEGVLPAMVAQNHSLAGVLLGTSFVWRAALGVVVYAVLALGCHVLGYGSEMQWAFALAFVASVLTSFVAACKDTIRGFERADIPAYAHVGQQLLWALLVVPVVLLGGRMRSVLLVGVVTLIIVLIAILRTLGPVGVNRLRVERSAFRSLFVGGTPFVVFGVAMALQPNIDAVFLSKLGSVEAVGWFAVSRRLLGLLLFPASALIGALYPTLCRLWIEDKQEFTQVTRGSLHSVALLVMPIALGCGLYPEIGVDIFSKESFGPAADNLRVLSFYLFLVYFTMPIGTCVLACGKQRAWSVVQSLCVIVSLVLDPLLTPWFQHRYGNGGLGPSFAAVVSELAVVICGVALMPRGTIDARLWRTFAFTIASGAAMVVAARLLHSINPFVAAPIATLAYGGALWVTGEIGPTHVAAIKNFAARKLRRGR